MWKKRLTKNERDRISNLDRLHNQIESLERDLRRVQSDYDEVFDYIRQQGEVSWTEMARDFERCEHCGYDDNGPQAESHFNWSHQECPVAFIKNCEEFIDETGNGNSTRSLIDSLFDEIKAHGDMELEARDIHDRMLEFSEEGEVPEDFDEYLKESGLSTEDVVFEALWGYQYDRETLNRRIVGYWIQDYERDIGPLPPLSF